VLAVGRIVVGQLGALVLRRVERAEETKQDAILLTDPKRRFTVARRLQQRLVKFLHPTRPKSVRFSPIAEQALVIGQPFQRREFKQTEAFDGPVEEDFVDVVRFIEGDASQLAQGVPYA
jgi:hypothetical protein